MLVQCLESILVDELTHLLERLHSERFTWLLDQLCRSGERLERS